jgi:hypothetical protein
MLKKIKEWLFGKSSATVDVPYKVEPPVVNSKTGDIVDVPVVAVVQDPPPVEQPVEVVPVKKPRKPRTPKAEVEVKEKAAQAEKPAAKRGPKKSKVV